MSSRHSPQGDGGPSTPQPPTTLTFAGGSDIRGMAKALGALGIEVGA